MRDTLSEDSSQSCYTKDPQRAAIWYSFVKAIFHVHTWCRPYWFETVCWPKVECLVWLQIKGSRIRIQSPEWLFTLSPHWPWNKRYCSRTCFYKDCRCRYPNINVLIAWRTSIHYVKKSQSFSVSVPVISIITRSKVLLYNNLKKEILGVKHTAILTC